MNLTDIMKTDLDILFVDWGEAAQIDGQDITLIRESVIREVLASGETSILHATRMLSRKSDLDGLVNPADEGSSVVTGGDEYLIASPLLDDEFGMVILVLERV